MKTVRLHGAHLQALAEAGQATKLVLETLGHVSDQQYDISDYSNPETVTADNGQVNIDAENSQDRQD
jgi:hypothetical protein